METKASQNRPADRPLKDNPKEPVRERIVINAQSIAFGGKPLEALFPFIDSEDFKNLPIANLELSYFKDETPDLIQKPGLRLNLDIQLVGCLSWVGDAMKSLFETSEKPPTIRLSALLSEERNWSKPPQIEKLVLQGYFMDLEFKPWNILKFETLGIELTALKNGDSWNFGFGFIGKVALTGIPEAEAPLALSYRIAREADEGGGESESGVRPSRTWTLIIDASNWKRVFGFDNVNVSFEKTSFR